MTSAPSPTGRLALLVVVVIATLPAHGETKNRPETALPGAFDDCCYMVIGDQNGDRNFVPRASVAMIVIHK